jgi:hypothetical protein
MADGIDINFGALKQPDYLGDYANAFKIGRDLAGQGIQQVALPTSAASTSAPLSPPRMIVAPTPGAGLQGGPQAATCQALTVQQAQAARDHAEKFAVALHGLQMSTSDPSERLRIAQHVAPALGIDPAKVTLDDVTDAGIAAHMTTVMALERQLSPHGGMSAPRDASTIDAAAPRNSLGSAQAPAPVLRPQGGGVLTMPARSGRGDLSRNNASQPGGGKPSSRGLGLPQSRIRTAPKAPPGVRYIGVVQ